MMGKLALVAVSVICSATVAYGGTLSCPGDCNDDGAVTVDEIITGVNIALGVASIESCPPFDVSGDQMVTVDEILNGVTVALEGCHDVGTPTPTVIPTPAGPSVARRAAGMITTSTQVFLALPDLVSALVNDGDDRAARATRGVASTRKDCPEGGDRTITCDQKLEGVPPLPRAEYELDYDDCESETEDGGRILIDGRVNLTGPRGQLCGVIPEDQDFAVEIDQLVIASSGGDLDTTTRLTDVDGEIAFSERDASCGFEQFNLKLDGDLLFEAELEAGDPLATIAAVMRDTRFRLHVDDYGSECRPLDYSLKVSDDITFTADDIRLEADYDDYVLEVDATSSSSADLRIRGGVTAADCFDHKVTFATDVNMHLGEDVGCPDAGQVSVTSNNLVGVIYYSPEGVAIDPNGDGIRDEMFPTCRDPALYQCPA